jgi:transposase
LLYDVEFPKQVFNALKAQKTKCQNRRQFCGRKKKLTPEQEALILRSILELRDEEGSFSSRRLMERTGIRHVTDRTVRRLLNRNGYSFLQARKKGLMSQTDKDQRVEFARKMQAEYSPSVWTDSVAFYLDGVSFVYKTNPLDQARAPKGKSMEEMI